VILNGGRCPSTVIENRTGGRKRRRNDHPSVWSDTVLSPVTKTISDTAKSMSSLISSSRKYRISFSCLMYVIIVVSFRIATMSWCHSRENYFRFLQWSVSKDPITRGFKNEIKYCRRCCTRKKYQTGSKITIAINRRKLTPEGQYCIGSNTRVIISPSLPSTGTILNNGTWASPTILFNKESELQKHLVLLPDEYYSSAKRISHRGEKAHEGTQE
jgi:hypothetical protein